MEISYFGMLRQCGGPGFGGLLLMDTITRAWTYGARQVWLHSCTLDHSVALGNYLARAFTVFEEETRDEAWPDRLAAASTANIGEPYIAQPEIVPFENSIGTVTRTNERS